MRGGGGTSPAVRDDGFRAEAPPWWSQGFDTGKRVRESFDFLDSIGI